MDGFEVLARTREIAPGLPVIIVTVRDTAADAVRALKLGAWDYVAKPFDDGLVLAAVKQALDGTPPVSGGPAFVRKPRLAGSPSQSPDFYVRPRCLVVARHLGTAAALRLVLDRYVPTNVALDGGHALRAAGIGSLECVVWDGQAWAADGTALVRVLRMRWPGVRVVMLTEAGEASPFAAGDARIAPITGLPEAIQYVLASWAPSATALTRPYPSDRVLAAVDYLRQHYAEYLSVPAITRGAAMSRGHLTERFRAELGLSLSGFLSALRVEVAKLLLTSGSAKLEQVAELTGFRDPSHLSRVFRALTKSRPGAYRRELAAP